MSEPPARIRDCVPGDAETLVNLVRELAVYEKLEQFALAGGNLDVGQTRSGAG